MQRFGYGQLHGIWPSAPTPRGPKYPGSCRALSSLIEGREVLAEEHVGVPASVCGKRCSGPASLGSGSAAPSPEVQFQYH